ncbi:hypothetical protein Pla52o_39070 [Novipirellula galeiformis]|uniref:Uncharacterized protein n=1 Tax=Novipirellula galeiformis TaxID=2528004 RepID=A0A5C6CAU3_9BACT|nr:hypothetical protein Pla52o_39070 [Novipirellula galeiformis]
MTAGLSSDHQEKVVYHYCDAYALLSILTNQKLWYTHAASASPPTLKFPLIPRLLVKSSVAQEQQKS